MASPRKTRSKAEWEELVRPILAKRGFSPELDTDKYIEYTRVNDSPGTYVCLSLNSYVRVLALRTDQHQQIWVELYDHVIRCSYQNRLGEEPTSHEYSSEAEALSWFGKKLREFAKEWPLKKNE